MKKLLIIMLSICVISNAFAESWSGTGFALNNRYIVTNYHVIDGADIIKISGTHKGEKVEYGVDVFACDIHNDLALLKITDPLFSGFGEIPFFAKDTLANIGEDVFALGYPLTETMGTTIKLSTGVISSLNGFQDDISLYQISAPIQPGNSGGPLFDKNGHLIGIVCAKHQGAENVSYAIKASYLIALTNSLSTQPMICVKESNRLSLMEKIKDFFVRKPTLTNQVETLQDFVFLVQCTKKYKTKVEYPKPSISQNCRIYYTSSDGNIIMPKNNVFGAKILSNTYKNGRGVIVFDKPILSIWKSMFSECHSLTSIEIPKSVTLIDNRAFFYCSSLTSVIIPSSVIKIGESAFHSCSSLTSITVPDSVTSIEVEAFTCCESLHTFYGKLASMDNRCLIINGVLNSFAPAGLAEYTIPNSITAIGDKAFLFCRSLTNVIIPNSVKSIGYMSFANCSSLTNITIGNGVTSIQSEVFLNCNSLKRVYCKPLSPPIGGLYMFSRFIGSYYNLDCKIYVPIFSVEAYKEVSYWNDYASQIERYDFE